MNTRRTCLWLFTCMCFALLCCCGGRAAAAESSAPSAPNANTADELRALRQQVQEQGQRIDRLYRALGPELQRMEAYADELQKQAKEDAQLKLDRIADVSNLGLTPEGAANPVKPEFAVVSADGAVQIFDQDGKAAGRLHAAGHNIISVAWSPSGKELVTGTDGGALLIWDAATRTSVVAGTNITRRFQRVAWVGNRRLAWGSSVDYWDNGKPVNQDKPSGAVLARDSGKVLWQFRSLIRQDFFTLAGALDGRWLVVLEIPGQPRGAFLLDGDTGELRKTFYDSGHGSGPLSAAISPDGNLVAVGYAPYDVILWDVATGARLRLLKGHSNWVVSLAFDANSKRLVSGGGDSTARVWDVPTGKEIGRIRFAGESTYAHSVGLSPAGDLVFALTQSGELVIARITASQARASR